MRLPSAPGDKRLWIYDIEVFPNHFLCSLFNGERWKEYDDTCLPQMAADLKTKTLVLAGFNNFDYDDMIVRWIVDNPAATTDEIYQLSKTLICDKSEETREALFRLKYADTPWAYSIDVFQLLNAKGSLKEWQCRIGFPTVKESPYDFDTPIHPSQWDAVRDYCRNDVLSAKDLLVRNWDKVVLRMELDRHYKLGNRVYCLSEQGIAQTTFLTLHRRRSGESSQTVRENAKANPDNARGDFALAEILSDKIAYNSPELQALHTSMQAGHVVGNPDNGGWCLSYKDCFKPFTYDGVQYKLGVGGLHSVDGPLILQGDETHTIMDMDVASYYPTLILNLGLYPKHLGPGFLADMKGLRDRRLAAKRGGDKKTADALKIVINATFGKLNDKWSPLRSVPDAHRITVNGQMFLLMLVERAVAIGAKVVSANTDGLTVHIPRAKLDALKATAREWEKALGLELEFVEYAAIFRRDVNNYMAIPVDGKPKYKGAIAADGGKADGAIIKKAAEAFITQGLPPDVTIQGSDNLADFLFYARTKNGGTLFHGEQEIGKTARWFVSTTGAKLKRKNPGHSKRPWDSIANGESCTLALTLDGLTVSSADIDYAFYEKAAWELIDAMGPDKPTTTACEGQQEIPF